MIKYLLILWALGTFGNEPTTKWMNGIEYTVVTVDGVECALVPVSQLMDIEEFNPDMANVPSRSAISSYILDVDLGVLDTIEASPYYIDSTIGSSIEAELVTEETDE